MNMNQTNRAIKQEILKQYGTYENFAKKTGYCRMYISHVLNGKNPMSDDFKQVLETALGIKLTQDTRISSRHLIDYLLDSSSLRQDLLIRVGGLSKIL